MDRKIIKELRKVLFLESLFTGAVSLTKALDETESELEDMVLGINKKFKSQRNFDNKPYKDGK